MRDGPLSVLVVDDSREYAGLVREMITGGEAWPDAVVDLAESYEEGLAHAVANSYHICIFDYWLGSANGLSLLREVRGRGLTMPVIVLTGQGDEDIAVDAMKAGAADYLSKANLGPQAIARAMRHALALHAEELQRRQAEEALRAAEERLRLAQRLEAVGQLAGGIAHDFNNLLTAILGYCSLLLDEVGDNPRMRGDLEEIRIAGERAAALTRQLLAFSRRQMLQPQNMKMNALVEQSQEMLRGLLGDRIELLLSLAPDLPETKVDPSSLEQVLIHLAMNARDAMPAGGRLTIETALAELDAAYASAHPPATAGRYILLAVSDSGEGMDKVTRSRVFEPFFTTKEQGKGVGLGLATVYGIVKQSGGYIWVYSEPGVGTTFKVYLPPAPGVAVDSLAPAEPAVAEGSGTVLLVDDDDVARALAREALQRYGYEVIESAGGTAALEAADRYRGAIDLLITDVVMPNMGGRDLANQLRARRPTLKVLFMSGYPEQAVVYREIPAGVAFMQKPFTVDGLVGKVRGLLHGGATRLS